MAKQRILTGVDDGVQENRNDARHVNSQCVCMDNLSLLQIRDKDPIEDAAIPIRRNISGEHLPDGSWTPPR